VAESRVRLYIAALLPNKHRLRDGESRLFSCIFLDTFRAGVSPAGEGSAIAMRNGLL